MASGGAAFITKLTPSATGAAQLAYSSYLGGDTFDEGFGIAVDGSGNAFIAGETHLYDFSTNGTQITRGKPVSTGNVFLTEINTTVGGTPSLVYSTYIGGSGAGSNFLGFGDVAYGLAIDATDDTYIVGGTTSTDFPVNGTAVAGSAACGANTNGSAFITVINTTAQTLTYSHCLSGNPGDELAFGVNLGTGVPAVPTKVAYITGTTSTQRTSRLPPTRFLPPGVLTQGVAFVSLLNTATGALQYSTYLGGTGSDTGFSIASDSAGQRIRNRADWFERFPSHARGSADRRNNVNGSGSHGFISP